MEGSASMTGRAAAALAALFVVITFVAAAAEPAPALKIIATLFPQYDFARQIAGERAEVRLLLPPGAESHSYEPTPSDMKAIDAADLFIYTGPAMEPWAKRLADSATRPDGVRIIDASTGITPRRDSHGHGDGNSDHDGHDHGENGHAHEYDPHIWLDPALAAIMADNIAAALVLRDPAGAAVYRENADRLIAELEAIDADFRATVELSPRRQLVFGERFAFAYLFARYGLEEIGAYKSCAPGAEPGLKAVIEVVNHVKEHKVKYIYLEAMSTSRISRIINQETGAEILTVDSLHNLPADKQRQGYTYQRVMRDNMAAFARGLEK